MRACPNNPHTAPILLPNRHSPLLHSSREHRRTLPGVHSTLSHRTSLDALQNTPSLWPADTHMIHTATHASFTGYTPPTPHPPKRTYHLTPPCLSIISSLRYCTAYTTSCTIIKHCLRTSLSFFVTVPSLSLIYLQPVRNS